MSTTQQVVERVCREESGRILATLIRVAGDFDLAEESLQEAYSKALERPTQPLRSPATGTTARLARTSSLQS